MEKYLIVGLGNLGYQYENTRHNVGFNAIDVITKKLSLKMDNINFNGEFCSMVENDNQFYFAKPHTFMNLSGNFVRDICKFYKIPHENIIVIYDDKDTDVGRIRIKEKGSSGGQNGIKNIIQLLGTENIKRIRIGIGKPKHDMVNHVLSRFNIDELVSVQMSLNECCNAILYFIKNPKFIDLMNNKYKI